MCLESKMCICVAGRERVGIKEQDAMGIWRVCMGLMGSWHDAVSGFDRFQVYNPVKPQPLNPLSRVHILEGVESGGCLKRRQPRVSRLGSGEPMSTISICFLS